MAESQFAFRNFLGRVLIKQGTGEAFTIVGWVGSHQFVVAQEGGDDLEYFVPLRALHRYTMLPRPKVDLDVTDDEIACAEDLAE